MRMRLPRVLLALAVTVLGGALAGCGSDNPEPISKDIEKEVRNPTHVPPANYKPVGGGGEVPGGAPATTGG